MNESMLNHNEIVALLYSGNLKGAIYAFSEKTREYKFSPFLRSTYLTSLNMAIYHYILMKENISLHTCCIANERNICKCTKESMLEIGIEIITSYGFDANYLSEKYKNIHIRHAANYIHEHLSESLTLEKVSENINVSSSYLCELFKQEVQISFSTYIFLQRMKLADALLKKTSFSIQNIAFQCGFHNTSYFSTCFKKFSGKRPTQARLNACNSLS